tara:strand:- start:2631 stop:3356 length:726 start_codon:yes stop_codon:yes gene_type:complete
MYQEEETSFYDLLEISPSAGPTEIYEAYQRARETYSPHSAAIYSMFTEEEARELLRLVDEAYSTLSNRSRKRAYDLRLGLLDDEELKNETPNAYHSHPNKSPEKQDSLVEERKVGRAEEGWTGIVKVHRKVDPLPEGQERTRFSTYTVDAQFEKDIEDVEECDGSFLQKIREYKNVPLQELSEAMKTSRSTLRALEENELDRLPVQVFTRGIVVQYCRMLGLDEHKVVAAYMTYYKSQKST